MKIKHPEYRLDKVDTINESTDNEIKITWNDYPEHFQFKIKSTNESDLLMN